MDPLLLVLRVLHIAFGTFWVGTDLFVTFLLLPRLRSLGREIERPVMVVLMRVLPPALMVSSAIVVVSGIWITGIVRGWNLQWVAATGWGWAVLIGSVGTFLALIVGFGVIPAADDPDGQAGRLVRGEGPNG